jgi:hypothetical protein
MSLKENCGFPNHGLFGIRQLLWGAIRMQAPMVACATITAVPESRTSTTASALLVFGYLNLRLVAFQ